MKNLLIILFLIICTKTFSQSISENYSIDSASVEHKGVPKREILKFTFENYKIFAGTTREVTVYVPAQYRANKPPH